MEIQPLRLFNSRRETLLCVEGQLTDPEETRPSGIDTLDLHTLSFNRIEEADYSRAFLIEVRCGEDTLRSPVRAVLRREDLNRSEGFDKPRRTLEVNSSKLLRTISEDTTHPRRLI